MCVRHERRRREKSDQSNVIKKWIWTQTKTANCLLSLSLSSFLLSTPIDFSCGSFFNWIQTFFFVIVDDDDDVKILFTLNNVISERAQSFLIMSVCLSLILLVLCSFDTRLMRLWGCLCFGLEIYWTLSYSASCHLKLSFSYFCKINYAHAHPTN